MASKGGSPQGKGQGEGGVVCAHCKTTNALGTLKSCNRCRRVFYCNADCQTAHWKHGGHKKVCKAHAVPLATVPGGGVGPQPGDVVEVAGLAKQPELNGSRAVVQPRAEWNPDRVLVLAETTPPRMLSLKASNLVVISAAESVSNEDGRCCICLDVGEVPPIQSGCACRGAGGLAHLKCRLELALRMKGLNRHTRCMICNEDFTGPMQHGLAEQLWSITAHHPENELKLGAAATRAISWVSQGKFAEGETELRRVLAGYKATKGATHPNTLSTGVNLATAVSQQGRHEEAEAMYRELVVTHKAVLGNHHPDTLHVLSNLAGLYMETGKYKTAETLYRELLKVRQRVSGKEASETLLTESGLAQLLGHQERYDEAEASFKALLPVMRRVLGPENANTLRVSNNMATVLQLQHKYDEAEAVTRAILPPLNRVFGREHPHVLFTRNLLVTALQGQGKFTEELAELRTLLPLEVGTFGAHHHRAIESRSRIVELESVGGTFL